MQVNLADCHEINLDLCSALPVYLFDMQTKVPDMQIGLQLGLQLGTGTGDPGVKPPVYFFHCADTPSSVLDSQICINRHALGHRQKSDSQILLPQDSKGFHCPKGGQSWHALVTFCARCCVTHVCQKSSVGSCMRSSVDSSVWGVCQSC